MLTARKLADLRATATAVGPFSVVQMSKDGTVEHLVAENGAASGRTDIYALEGDLSDMTALPGLLDRIFSCAVRGFIADVFFLF